MKKYDQPAKRKWALLESNPPGIAGRDATDIRPGELPAPPPIRKTANNRYPELPPCLKKLNLAESIVPNTRFFVRILRYFTHTLCRRASFPSNNSS